MATTWTIAVDWDKNGNYSGTYDDVTGRVISASWFLGMRQAYQDVADNSVLSLVLRNDDRRYSPEYTSSPLTTKVTLNRPVRIQSNDGTTTRTHWTGWIESIQPSVNLNGQRIVTLIAAGTMQFYTAAETKLGLQVNQRADQIIAALLAEIPSPPASSLEVGMTLPLAADNWVKQGGYTDSERDTFDVYHAIADIAGAERGRFFFDRSGTATFWNRAHLLYDQPIDVTLNDAMMDLSYTYAGIDRCKNEVIIVCHPRNISASTTEVLWQLVGAVITIAPGQTRKLYVKYQDDSGNRIGGQTVTLTGVTFAQGTASSSIAPKANGAELTFINSGSVDAIVNAAIVRGQKITTFDIMEATSKDQPSIDNYGRRTLKLNLPALTNVSNAQDIADFERNRRSTPRGEITSITLRSHGKQGGGYHAEQLGLTIGDRISVQETQTAHNGSYYIIGEAHSLTKGATVLETTWYLERTPDVYPWVLGHDVYSRLGVTTKLG
ncbi:MAG: hypothetical protein IAE89_04430 [Anaerolineae bacterium]|nr:hypothetical protein [Anaerolineae bacterium]